MIPDPADRFVVDAKVAIHGVINEMVLDGAMPTEYKSGSIVDRGGNDRHTIVVVWGKTQAEIEIRVKE